MAIWNDPQPPKTGFGASPSFTGAVAGRGTVVDQGLRRYMLSIYNYMASGVLLSGVVALLFQGVARDLMLARSPLMWLIILAPIGFVMAMSFGINKMRTGTLQALFWAFAVTMGLSLSTIFVVYTGASVAAAFFASAAAFAGLSLVGYTTKRDLSGFGTFLIMGVFGLIVASVINIFLKAPALYWAINFLGVLIFAGLTAYDTQRLKTTYYHVAGSDMMGKVVIMGALSLYLDFINLFQFLLSFMGNRR
jgi:FtsH-binding integral membrane protein